MNKISFLILFLALVLEANIITVGGFEITKYPSLYSFHNDTPKKTRVPITDMLEDESKNVNGVTMWITRTWQENWYNVDTIQKKIINKGYMPVFIFYYFADDVSVAFIQKYKQDYFKHLKKFTKFLKRIDGKKIVILNPEYNMNGVSKWVGMNDIFLKSFAILRGDPEVKVGPCVGDFGNYSQANVPQEWKLFDPSLKKAAKSADFIAFQEMRAVTRNSKEEILNTSKRAYFFSKYLHKKYKKPTVLAYLAISSYGKFGEKIQAAVYRDFVYYLPKMKKESNLQLFGIFHYFDYPKHVGYFKKAEEFFGIVTKEGIKKPSFKYFNVLE